MLTDKMANSKRVNTRKELCVKLAFGRAKVGHESEGAAYEKYICIDGDAIEYSQEGETYSPLETKL